MAILSIKRRRPDIDYAFAVGRIRAMERFLIKGEVFEEAIESDLTGALRLFAEAGSYSAELLQVKDSARLEAILDQELSDVQKLIRSLILDKELYPIIEMDDLRVARRLSESFKGGFLSDYLLCLVDMHNIKTFLRLYVLKEPKEKLNELLSCDGFIKKKDLLKLYSQDLTVFLHRLEYVHKREEIIDYAYYLRDAIKRTVQENSFIYLEKAVTDLLMRILKSAQYLTFGPEPVIAYYFARLNEIGLIRMIILAKLNDLPDMVLKERLNILYA